MTRKGQIRDTIRLRQRKSLYPLWKDRSGITLVEVIVNLALMGILMMAAVFVITTSLRVFDRMQSLSRAMMVSNMILDQMTDELDSVMAEMPDEIPDKILDKIPDKISDEIPEKIQDTIRRLQDKSRKPGSNVYLGFEIQHLVCLRPRPEEHPDVFRIDLTLYLERTGMTYETYRYVKTFQNADSDEILEEDILEE